MCMTRPATAAAARGVGTVIEGAEATWAYNLNGQIVTLIDERQ